MVGLGTVHRYDALFDTVDDDESNLISFDEFERMVDSINLGFSTAEARHVFQYINRKGGGDEVR